MQLRQIAPGERLEAVSGQHRTFPGRPANGAKADLPPIPQESGSGLICGLRPLPDDPLHPVGRQPGIGRLHAVRRLEFSRRPDQQMGRLRVIGRGSSRAVLEHFSDQAVAVDQINPGVGRWPRRLFPVDDPANWLLAVKDGVPRNPRRRARLVPVLQLGLAQLTPIRSPGRIPVRGSHSVLGEDRQQAGQDANQRQQSPRRFAWAFQRLGLNDCTSATGGPPASDFPPAEHSHFSPAGAFGGRIPAGRSPVPRVFVSVSPRSARATFASDFSRFTTSGWSPWTSSASLMSVRRL